MPAGERLAEQNHGTKELQGRIDVAYQSNTGHRQTCGGIGEQDHGNGC